MKNPFRNRKKEAVVSHTTVPKDWFSMTMAERLDWAGELLGGLAPDVEEASPEVGESPDGSVQESRDNTEWTTCEGFGTGPPSQDDTDKS